MNLISAIISLIVIIINIIIVYWLHKIDKCVCAKKIPEKKYLKEWFTILVIFSIVYNIILYNLNLKTLQSISTLLIIIQSIIAIINIVMLIRLFIYIFKLRKLECECGLLKYQSFIYYYLIVIFSLVAFILLMLISFLLYITLNAIGKNK